MSHLPINGHQAPLVRFGEARTPLVKIEDARMRGTGYSIYQAAPVTYTWNSSKPEPGVTFDIIGSQNGTPVANSFFKWSRLPSCR